MCIRDSYNILHDSGRKVQIITLKPLGGAINSALNEINNMTFISLTNKTEKIPNNIIAFGINTKSQINVLKKYFEKIEISKTLFLSPQSLYATQAKIITDSKIKFYKT